MDRYTNQEKIDLYDEKAYKKHRNSENILYLVGSRTFNGRHLRAAALAPGAEYYP